MLINFSTSPPRPTGALQPGTSRPGLAACATVVMATALIGGGSTLLAQGEEAQPKRVRINYPSVVITVMEGSVSRFEEVPIFAVAFKRSPAPDAETVIVETGVEAGPGKPTPTETIPIYLLEPTTPDFARAISIESCALEGGVPVDCRAVRATARIPTRRKDLRLQLDQRVDWRKSLLRLRIPAGTFKLMKAIGDTEEAESNPLVETVLPILGTKDLQFVESRPYFSFEITPIARAGSAPSGTEPREAASLDFRGGAFRSLRESQWGVSWSGSVGTVKDLTFNRLRGLLEYEHNLRAGDFLPAEAAFVTESDQNFDVVDTSLTVGVRYLLPLHVNGSPFSNFVPTTGPRVRLMGGIGRRARGAANLKKNFRRAGYDLQWRIPVSADALIAIHHAGLWAWDDFRTDEGEFHDLWDLVLEMKLGQLTYFVGYQRGDAAPLFQPINTTRAGLIVRFK